MSSLKWQTAVYVTSAPQGRVPTTYWELWALGQDQTAWYNLPCAQIRKLKDRQWELSFPDRDLHTQHFTTLKAAKAMGIVLVQMEN